MRAKVIGYIPLDREAPKKTRISHLVDVTRAQNESDRVNKLASAARVFSHHDKSKHDQDIQAGAVCNSPYCQFGKLHSFLLTLIIA